MSIPIIATLSRQNDGNFPLLVNTDVFGGWMTVADNAARDAILSSVRTEGMRVYSVAARTLYQLESDLVTWSVVTVDGGQQEVVWRPGTPTGPETVETWAEVQAAIVAAVGFITVWVDTSLATAVITAGVTECYGLTIFRSYGPGSNGVSADDGAQLRNVREFNGVQISGAPTTIPYLVLDIAQTALAAREGAIIDLGPGATVSAISFEATGCQIAAFQGALYTNSSGNPALSVVQVASGLQALQANLNMAGSAGPSSYPANLFAGDATCLLIQIYDSSAQQVAQPNFLGAIIGLPMSFAAATVYDDATTTPTTGAATVQELLDTLKRRVTGSGPTAGRPAVGDVDVGAMYFDTDLGIPVWSNGVVYVDATGTPV